MKIGLNANFPYYTYFVLQLLPIGYYCIVPTFIFI